MVIPPDCALTGWGALRWLGARWFGGQTASGQRRPVTIAIGTHDIRAQEGIAVSAEGLSPAAVIVVDGLAITRPVYSVSFEMRYADSDRQAAQVLSMAAYDDLVSIDEQLAFMTPGQNGWTGVPRGRRSLPLAGENFWSPREHAMCLVWQLDAGLPRPLANQPVFDLTGRHIGTPDLIDAETGVFGQYNGAVHLEGTQASKDIRSDAALRCIGLEGVTMVAADAGDTRHVVGRLVDAYARASAKPASDRGWTIEPPSWWTSTTSVAARRALDDDQRRRLLAYRRAS